MAGGLIDEIFIALGFKVDDKQLKNADKNVKSTMASIRNMALATAGAVLALDRMANSLAKMNQQFVNFNRQTGLSINNLNRIAGAAMMSDYNFTPEQAMQGLQSLESNLAQIRLGQGNIAPFQILGISPVGKDATQIIEDLRVAIKGIDDMTAVNLIQQMGLSPEFISLLRMTREEMDAFSAQANQYMLNEEQRQALHKYSMELKLVHMEMGYLKDKALIAIMPHLVNFLKGFNAIVTVFENALLKIKSMIEYVGQFKGALLGLGGVALAIVAKFNPLLAALTALYLILEDLAIWALGGKSLLKLGFDKASELLNPNSQGEQHTNDTYKELYGKDRNFISKYTDWALGGGIVGTMFHGATRQQQYYDNLLRYNGGTGGTQNNTQTVNQNNYMNFNGVNPQGIAETTADLAWTYLQADRTV